MQEEVPAGQTASGNAMFTNLRRINRQALAGF
jgi:hypothetical protein